MSAPITATSPAPRERVVSVDVLRGAVMVVMAIDHVRDFFMNLPYQPEDLAQSNVALFLTRWITHFCAPTFFLLAGTGVGLTLTRGRTLAQASRFLVTRGLWLIFLELTILAFAWRFSLQLTPAILLVIWALGWSMIALALLIHLPRAVLVVVGLAMVVFHNLLDGISPATFGAFAPLWKVLHAQGPIGENIFVAYPLIPWIGVMALGFALADVYRWEADRRRRFLLRVGLAATLAFVVLRAINHYGDPRPWTTQRDTAMTIASFLNTSKYPPSLLYLLMTLGPMLVVLAVIERGAGLVTRWLTVYGRVPFFYYILHLYLIHGLAIVLALIQGGTASFGMAINPEVPAWYGVGLPGVYGVWAIVVLALYFPCRWFVGVKARRRDWWLSYL